MEKDQLKDIRDKLKQLSSETKNQNAISYIINIIKSLIPNAHIEYNFKSLVYKFFIFVDEKQCLEVNYGHAEVCDLETVLTKDITIDQRVLIENNVKFRIYILFGKEGLIPNFSISEELLNEKRDWIKNIAVDFNYEDSQHKIFYSGLQQLSDFIKNIFKAYNIVPSESKKEKSRIDDLISYYNKKGSFNESGVSTESLGYFKAAAICYIIDKEHQKKKIVVPSVLREIDRMIYSVVDKLRVDPFPQIKMPNCISDYAAHSKGETAGENQIEINKKLSVLKDWIPFASNKKVFIAHRFNEINLIDKVKDAFNKEGFECIEGKVQDLGFVTDDILYKIKNSGFFLALITPVKKFEDEKYSTSSWILMEIGVAISYGRVVLVLAENCIEQEEYARKLQAESQYEIFDRNGDFIDKLQISIERIKKEWKKQNS